MFKLSHLLPALTLFGLTACGGGGGGSSSSGVTLNIGGTAATGAAISGGTIEAQCKTGTGTAQTSSDGTYTVTISNAQAPCILRVTDPQTGRQYHSMAEDGATKANINPVTELITSNTLGATPSTAFTDFSTYKDKVTASQIQTATANVQALTKQVGTDSDMTGVDILKVSMTATTASTAGDATDKKLDALMAALAAADKKIADLTEQIKQIKSATEAQAAATTTLGSAVNALESCPSARSGDIWVLDFTGMEPVGYNVDFKNKKLKRLTDNKSFDIGVAYDKNEKLLPCVFGSYVDGTQVEYRVTDGGMGIWSSTSDYGITVPQQKNNKIDSQEFAGTYPSIVFLRNKTTGQRAALPFKYQIDSSGKINAYSCDLSKSVPDCGTLLDTSGSGMNCVKQTNGTAICESTDGKMKAIAIPYINGSQATMLMAITKFNYSSSVNAGGLLVMTKASEITLPSVGKTYEAGMGWIVSLINSSLYETLSPKMVVDSIDASKNLFVKSVTDGSAKITAQAYINTPAKGMYFQTPSSGGNSVVLSAPLSGWEMSIARATSNADMTIWSVVTNSGRTASTNTTSITNTYHFDPVYSVTGISAHITRVCIANC